MPRRSKSATVHGATLKNDLLLFYRVLIISRLPGGDVHIP